MRKKFSSSSSSLFVVFIQEVRALISPHLPFLCNTMQCVSPYTYVLPKLKKGLLLVLLVFLSLLLYVPYSFRTWGILSLHIFLSFVTLSNVCFLIYMSFQRKCFFLCMQCSLLTWEFITLHNFLSFLSNVCPLTLPVQSEKKCFLSLFFSWATMAFNNFLFFLSLSNLCSLTNPISSK